MGCRELFLAQSNWRERRAAHEEVRLELLPSATVHVTPAGGRQVASVVRVGLVQVRGRSFAEAGRICDPVVARHHIPRPGDQSFLLLLVCGCRLQGGKKAEESFTGRQVLIKLCSTVPLYDTKTQVVLQQAHRAGHDGRPW